MKRIISNKYFLVIIAALLLSFIWFKDGLILGTAESGLPFYDLKFHFDLTKYAWAEPALGNATGVNVASSPTYFVLSKLETLGFPNSLIEASVFWFLLATAGIFIYLLTKQLFPKIKPKYLLICVFFYWFNPLFAVNIWNRFLINFMFFWALLPCLLFLYIKGLRDKDLRYAILCALSTLIFSYALTSLAFVAMIVILIAFIFLYYVLLTPNKKFVFVYFITTIFSFLLLNAWWISQLPFGTSSASYQPIISHFFTSVGNLEGLTSISSRLGQLGYVFRFLHKTVVLEGPAWISIFNNPLISIFQFFLTGVILWVIYKLRSNFEVVLLGSIFIFSMFFLKGNSAPLGEIFEFLFVKFSFLQVYRNPFEKMGFIAGLASAPLLALGLSEIEKAIRPRWKNTFFLGVTAYVALFLGFSFWSGKILSDTSLLPADAYKDYKVEVPTYYSQARDWFEENAGGARVVVVPLYGEGITYSWQYPYRGVEVSNILLGVPSISYNTTIPFYNDVVSEISKDQLSDRLFDYYPYLNAKYLLLRPDINFLERAMVDPEVVRPKIREWEVAGKLIKKEEFGPLQIFEVNNSYFSDKFYISSDLKSEDSEILESIAEKTMVEKPQGNVADKVAFQKVNPTEYKVKLNKTSSQMQTLVFSELFNPGWELIGEDGKVMQNRHLLVNVYANGWTFDAAGDYSFRVKFAPQKALETGQRVSLISIAGMLSCLGLLSWRKKSLSK